MLIVEVLSPSDDYARGEKYELYRTISTLLEYLIVHEDRRFLEHNSRQEDGNWLLREHAGAGASVAVNRLGVNIPLAELCATALNLD
jgi:Uma2 family endonuclease